MWLRIWFVATARIGFWTWIWPDTLWTGAGSGSLISRLGKLELFYLAVRIIVELLMSKWMGLSLMENHLLIWWFCISPLNWIVALTLSLLLTLHLRKLGPWFVLSWRYNLHGSMKFLSWDCLNYYESNTKLCMQ